MKKVVLLGGMLGLMGAQPALAVRPVPTTDGIASAIGSGEPVRHKVLTRAAPDTPTAARRVGAVLQLEAAAGGWSVLWDAVTDAPAVAYGPGLPLADADTREAHVRASRAFLAEHAEAFGVGLSDLTLVNAARGPKSWYVRFARFHRGVPVVGAGIDLRFTDGKLVLVRADTHPDLSVGISPVLGPHPALALGAERLSDRGWKGVRELDRRRLVILPRRRGEHGLAYHLAWETEAKTRRPAGHVVSYVDAVDGEVLAQHNRYLYATPTELTVQGEYEPRLVGDDLTTEPFEFLGVVGSDGTATLEVDGTEEVDLAFRGVYSDVDHMTAEDAAETVVLNEGEDEVFTWTGSSSTITERNAFKAHQVVRQRMLQMAPDLGWIDSQIQLNVGIDSDCNAYWDGSANFFRESNTCNDTGRIADVVYHEIGHGLHMNLLEGVFDGAVSEGSADYLAATITGDPNIAPTFFKDGRALRNIEENRVYPDDLTGEVHADGVIWAGALWDLRTILIDRYGYAEGVERADRLLADALRGGPTLSDGYYEVLRADDDDADLSNGTPHVCQINDAFGRHGLGPGPGPGIAFDHAPLGAQRAEESLEIRTRVRARFPQCGTFDTETVSLFWRLEGEPAFEEVPVEPAAGDDEQFTAVIPGAPAGSRVEYYFQAGSGAAQRTDPRQAPEKLYQFYVGPLITVFFDDFEDGPGEWTHGYTRAPNNPESEELADDWQHGVPQGLSGDPDHAFSGSHVWGNDLGAGDYNGAYRPNVTNYLRSPKIDLRRYRGTRLQLRRWLNVEDARYDQARIRINGDVVWVNTAGNGVRHHRDGNWYFVDVDISKWADRRIVTVELELASDAGLEMGGWTVDDVAVVATGTGPPPDDGTCNCALTARPPAGIPAGAAVLALLAGGGVMGRRWGRGRRGRARTDAS